MLSKSAYQDVFPSMLVSPSSFLPSRSASWDIVVQWLKSFDFLSPPENVKVALVSLEPQHHKLVEAYKSLIKSHYYQNFAPQLVYPHGLSEEDEAKHTLSLIEKMETVFKLYMSVFVWLKTSGDSVARFVKGLLIKSVMDCDFKVFTQVSVNTVSEVFVSNMVKIFRLYLGSGDSDLQSSLENYFRILDSCGFSKSAETIMMYATKISINSYITETFRGVWDHKVENQVLDFIESSVLQRLSETYIFFAKPVSEVDTKQQLEIVWEDIRKISKQSIFNLRVDELYDIVKLYPSSIPALEEIKACVSTHHQRTYLTSTFSAVVKKKLLHPGTPTIEVIKFYISMIKSFLVIDPRGVLLDRACRPTRRYLKEKNDTIKHIVSGLVDDSENNELSYLSDELQKAADQKDAQMVAEDDLDLNWTPDPIDALPDFKVGKVGDIVNAVTSLFESKSYFINEFLKHFSRQLINIDDYNIEDILAKVNLLKIKFENSNEFDSLDVMVNDVVISNKIDQMVHKSSDAALLKKFHSTIVSYLFWPKDLVKVGQSQSNAIGLLGPSKFKFPPKIDEMYSIYSKRFSEVKKGRKLEPVYNLGKVTVELELEDRTKQFQVAPHIASVIALFDGVQSLSFERIMELLEMDEDSVELATDYWIKQRILEREGDEFKVVEREVGNIQQQHSNEKSFEQEGKENEGFKAMEVIWPFIQGMLTNLGAMEVAKIKGFLAMAVPSELNFEQIEKQLEDYLNHLVDEDRLEVAGGKFNLR